LIRRIKKHHWNNAVVGVEFVSPDVVTVLRRSRCCVLEPKHEIRVGYDAQNVIRYMSADCDAAAGDSVARLGGGRTCGAVLDLVRQRLTPGADGAKAIAQLRQVDYLLGDLLNNHAGPAADAGRSVKWEEPKNDPSVWLTKVARRVSRVSNIEADWEKRTIGRGKAIYLKIHNGRWVVAESAMSDYRGSTPIREHAPRHGTKGPCGICGGSKHYSVPATHCNSLPHKVQFELRLRELATWLNDRASASGRREDI
jgi:hypothetical protein